MFKRCLVAENRKLHASPIWIVFFVLPVISAIYGTYNYLQNLGILTDQWYSLWTQHTLFYALFFFPVLVGVYAAYLWRLEHMGTTGTSSWRRRYGRSACFLPNMSSSSNWCC